MPRILDTATHCKACPHGYCVTYIREQSKKMKDRDTLYRVRQIPGMACAFEDYIPGFSKTHSSKSRLIEYAELVVANAKLAGNFVEANDPEFFGKVEAGFIITSGQSGKVRGDVFEMLCRAVLWNCAAIIRNSADIALSADFFIPPPLQAAANGRKIALLTLGDNYDLKNLLNADSANKLRRLEEALLSKGTSIKYSTPDIVCIDTTNYGTEINDHFNSIIDSLNGENQEKLARARSLIEGMVEPADIIFAGRIKTSIRSDRMYQFLYEANSWKFLWSRAFHIKPSQYYVLTSEIFGADPTKLASVDFSSLENGLDQARRAIDGVFHLDTAAALIEWLVDRLKA